MKFQVITKVPDIMDNDAMVGNLAVALPIYAADPHGDTVSSVNPMAALALRVPVFVLGEILIVDDDGREMVGRGRKADKWSVGYEEFEFATEAVMRAQEVLEEA